MTIEQKIENSINLIRRECKIKPVIALILGSGLGDFADSLKDKIIIPTSKIPHYPVSTVSGHRGNLVFGYLKNIPIMASIFRKTQR